MFYSVDVAFLPAGTSLFLRGHLVLPQNNNYSTFSGSVLS